MSQNRYLFYALLSAVIIMLLCSCSAMTKLKHKDKVNEQVNTETKTDQATVTASNTAITRTITEEVNDTAVIGASEADTDAFLHDLDKGITFTQGDVTLTAKTDSTGKIHIQANVKPRKVPVVNKRTVIESIFSNSTATVNTKSDVKINDKKQENKVDVSKDRKATVNWNIVIPVCLLLLLILVYFLIRQYLPWNKA